MLIHTELSLWFGFGLAFFLLAGLDILPSQAAAPNEMSLPPGVKAVWDLENAYREKTPTREKVCLNGLWRWQPAQGGKDAVPADAWGFFKVPGFWPGGANYAQEDCQILYRHPVWKNADIRNLSAAWYQRDFTVPADWTGRRITLAAEYVHSLAIVFVDGKKAGEIPFPGGETYLTSVLKPGGKYSLSLLVVALPLKGVLLSYSDSNAAREVKGTVERRGLCGDVWLTSTPAGPRITDIKVNTSVRQGALTVSSTLVGLKADATYFLGAEIKQGDKIIRTSRPKPFKGADTQSGVFSFTDKWQDAELWDLHTPQNIMTLHLYLLDEARNPLDLADPVRFGFREFWIDGKDFYLNGTRLFLSAVPIDNAQLGARTAGYEGALETMKRLKSFGINFVYTHNYGCQPGSHVSFNEMLRAADEIGILVGFSQPHFGHYDWKMKDADRANGYARHAEYYVRAAQNHPSVVAYSMSHNATGYDEDMNPDLIDGIHDPHKDKDNWSQNNAKLALRAEAIVKSLDPTRIVYHHSSGNLGSMHTSNFYINFAPIQEVSDWFEHWSAKGVKPMFPVEYGVPFSWDWAMYRGWYKGVRTFGSAVVPWEFSMAEWNAQFVGDRAYKISNREKQNLRFEAKQFKAGNLWHRWDYPNQLGSRDFDERGEIFARYITDNWRAFRSWDLSATSPWEHSIFWKLRPGVNKARRDFKVDWDDLQKPGFSADYTERQNWQMVTDFDRDDWVPTAAGQALYRNNMPLLAFIGGPRDEPTAKGHNYLPGETVQKQLIVINNSREKTEGDCTWSIDVGKTLAGKVVLPTGAQARLSMRFSLPPSTPAGNHKISATVRFSNGEVQEDKFTIDVLPNPVEKEIAAKIALFDPQGETAKLLKELHIAYQAVDAKASLAGYDVLIVGKNALTPDSAGPDVMRVRDGLKVIVFEQNAKALERRFGFRIAEYGLREVFPRVPDHPLLAGLTAEHLHDWRGEATILPPRLDYQLRPRYGPTVKWCDIDVPRVWRCGCRGNVASVLIEKPACGDFLSIVDGGFALQYSPLLEYREGKGLVLFCQMDVTGRTKSDPAATALARNILSYVSSWKPSPSRSAIYVGDPAGKRHLQAAGFSLGAYSKQALTPDGVLIVGPGGAKQLAADAPTIAGWLKAGGRILAIGLDGAADASAILPVKVQMTAQEHIASYFPPLGMNSAFTGIGPADVHNRDPRNLPLVVGGAITVGDGVLAQAKGGNVVFCQLVPWQFDPNSAMNLKRTFRHSSCLVARLLGNMDVQATTPILSRFGSPVDKAQAEKRWLNGLYLDVPGEWDDPYRFFRW